MPLLDFMNDVKPLVSLEPFPEADYELIATECEELQSANGDSSYLRTVFEVLSGDHAGRRIYQNFTFTHTSEKAVTYGHGMIKAWGCSCNKPLALDTDELIDVPCSAHVYVEPGTEGYADKNQISIFNYKDTPVPQAPAPDPKKPGSPTPSPVEEKPVEAPPVTPKPAPAAKTPAPAPKVGANPWD
jgi:hypothetical protein